MSIRCLLMSGLLILLLSPKPVFSQTFAAGDTTAIAPAVALYHQFLQPETNLYNGCEYVDYAYTIVEGSPFFMTAQFGPGSVVYNNMSYADVPLLYDIVKGEVVINDPPKLHKISLTSERIMQFTLLDHRFVRLTKDSIRQSLISTGFYELLYAGNNRLYKKEIRTVQEKTPIAERVERYIEESINYFLEKKGVFYKVNNRKAFLAATGERKKDMQRFLKKNNLRFKKNKEAALVKATAHFDE